MTAVDTGKQEKWSRNKRKYQNGQMNSSRWGNLALWQGLLSCKKLRAWNNSVGNQFSSGHSYIMEVMDCGSEVRPRLHSACLLRPFVSFIHYLSFGIAILFHDHTGILGPVVKESIHLDFNCTFADYHKMTIEMAKQWSMARSSLSTVKQDPAE